MRLPPDSVVHGHIYIVKTSINTITILYQRHDEDNHHHYHLHHDVHHYYHCVFLFVTSQHYPNEDWSRLYNVLALLINANSDQIIKLQRVQNAAARILSKTSKFTHITPVLKQLHWLPVVERIKFKILLLTWKIVHGFAPHYFDDLFSEYVPSRNLRSSGTGMLTPRRVKCSFGEKAFATSAPVLWNALPSNVRNAKSVESFKSGLKTYLFSSYFD